MYDSGGHRIGICRSRGEDAFSQVLSASGAAWLAFGECIFRCASSCSDPHWL